MKSKEIAAEPMPVATAVRHRTSDELAEDRTGMAAQRTLMAADRSLMAWIRTGLSMISFGFTIYKLLEGFQADLESLGRGGSPRQLGLFLTGLGTVAVIIGTIEYWSRIRKLAPDRRVSIWTPAFVMALIMSATGLFLFVGITSRLL
jgi:putative membrane protein